MTEKIDTLDYGFVRLVNHMGGDIDISRAARVSYNGEWRAKGEDVKLINYLWTNGHTSPFEHVTFTFEVKAPLFVIAQWQRHRVWSFNQQSARYTEMAEEFYVPSPGVVGKQSTDNKQARIIGNPSADSYRIYEAWMVSEHHKETYAFYKNLLEAGWPRELARTVLPVATYSHMFATVNLLNLFRFLTLRSHSHAQYEIRVFADAMLELIRPIVPVAVGAWEKTNERI